MSSSDRHVQAMVPVEVHKTLRDIAYVKKLHLRDLVRKILTDYAVSAQAELKKAEEPTSH